MSGPWFLRLIARVLLPRRNREWVMGDLEELYALRASRSGRLRASGRYLADVFFSVPSPRDPSRRLRPADLRPARPGPGRFLGDLFADLRFALRTWRREPGLAAIAVFTLALGIGPTTAVFSMVNQLVLRPLPGVFDPDGAAYLQFRTVSAPERTQGRGLPIQEFDEIRRGATLLSGMAAYGLTSLHVSLGEGRPTAVSGNTVYGDFFEVLGVRPVEGRLLRGDEATPESDPLVAVISQRLRSSLFPPDEEAVGRTIRMNGHAVAVLGVAEEGFRGPERGDEVDVWLPHSALVPLLGFTPEMLRSPQSTMHGDIVVRLREGAGPQALEGQILEILERMAATSAENGPYLAELRPRLFPGLHTPPMWRERTNSSLRILAGVVGLVLLIACGNVANLLLFRNVTLRGKVATRRALGASSGRIARQHLVSSLLLAVLGSLLGLGAGWLMALSFRGQSLLRMPAFEGVSLDWRVSLFAAGVSILSVVFFGTIPATLAGRFDLGGALRESGGRDTGRSGTIRSALAAGQIALSLSLLVGGLLLARTMRNLYAVDTGLSIDRVVILPLDLPRGLSEGERYTLERELLTGMARVPGTEAAALGLYAPHGPSLLGKASLPESPEEVARVPMVPVTPGWFELFGVEVVAGRTFEGTEWEPGPTGRVVITASLARRLFGRMEVTGRTILAGFGPMDEMEVVGVTEDLRMAYALDEPQDAFFVSFQEAPDMGSLTLMVRASAMGAQLSRGIQEEVERILPSQPVADPVPLSQRVDSIHSERRIFGRLLGLLSALALLLSAVGLYGVVSSAVAGRRREFGIRIALGAEGASIAGLVSRYAGWIVGPGTLLGLGGAYVLSVLLRSRLFGVEPLDAWSYLLAAFLLGAVAAIACWMPALAAVRVDPVTTLKDP